MKTLDDFIDALKISFGLLSNKVVWSFLIPSLIIGVLFLAGEFIFYKVKGASSSLQEIRFLGGFLYNIVNAFLSFIYSTGDILFKFIILTLFSPINCILSEKADSILTGQTFNISLSRILKEIGRAIIIAFLATFMYALATVIWWFLAKLLHLSFLNTIVYLCMSAFFISFSFFDYSLERYKKGVGKTFEFGFSNAMPIVLTGLIFSGLFMIPYIGKIIAPFIATIVSTVVYLMTERKISAGSQH